MAVVLKVRQTDKHNWQANFSRYGWKIRRGSGWYQLTSYNTKIRSADNTQWLEVK